MKQLKGISLGTFPFANVFGTIDEESASEILKRFIEYGGDFIHVSLVYNNFEVEKFLGKQLKKYPRDSYKIMACCGWAYENGVAKLNGTKSAVEECCNGTLERLGLDHLDVLMSHAPDTNTPYEETIDAMAKMRTMGKCKQLCVSNVSLDMLKRYNYSGQVDYIQNRFSLLNQAFDSDLVKYCLDHGIQITTYQSIERGLLSNRILDGLKLDEADLRNKKPEFKDTIKAEIANWMATYLLPIASREKLSILSLVLCWTLQNQPVDSVLCGISKMKYLDDYLIAAKHKLAPATINDINRAYDAFSVSIREKYHQSVREFMGLI